MDKWEPISLDELNIEIQKGVQNMTKISCSTWNKISIKPEKWSEKNYGLEGNGFWVVAVLNEKIIWYNDIEEGFNISSFSKYGVIDEYRAEQDELEWTMKKLKRHHNIY